MVANLGILGFFKYFDFFVESLATLLEGLGFHASRPVLGIVLPAGISFYTFQAMSYTIDIYRGKTEPTRNFGDFALFVCFFPHLVAGPIMRAHTLLPQVIHPRVRSATDFREGLALVLIGLFKKLVLADNMAPIANSVFVRLADGNTAGLSGSEIMIGIYAFAFQIYGDFSGYSSIARGISKWLGFDLVINFHIPYLAVTPSDFWRRWHISLSSWLRDYLYIPLGGNRHGRLVEYRSLIITMLLGGLWHGASWTFVAWGLYHGAILCAYRLAGIREADRSSAAAALGCAAVRHVPPDLPRMAALPGRELRVGGYRPGHTGQPMEHHGSRQGRSGHDRVLRGHPVPGRVADRRGKGASADVPRALVRAGCLVRLPRADDRVLLFAPDQ